MSRAWVLIRLLVALVAVGSLSAGHRVLAGEGVFLKDEIVHSVDQSSGALTECKVLAVDPHGVLVKFKGPDGTYDDPRCDRKYVSRHHLRHIGQPVEEPEAKPSPPVPTFESGPIVPIRSEAPGVRAGKLSQTEPVRAASRKPAPVVRSRSATRRTVRRESGSAPQK